MKKTSHTIENAIDFLTRYENRRADDSTMAFEAGNKVAYKSALQDISTIENIIVQLRAML